MKSERRQRIFQITEKILATPCRHTYIVRTGAKLKTREWGPVHTYPEIFVSANFFMRIQLASTRVRRIRSVYPEISVYALQSGNFCIRCVSGYVWTLVSVYFCIRWRHSIRTSLNAHALLTNPLRCPDTNRIRVDRRIRFVHAKCGRRYFCILIKKFADTKISGYVWTGPDWTTYSLTSNLRPFNCEKRGIKTHERHLESS